jgi:hypothetical protein
MSVREGGGGFSLAFLFCKWHKLYGRNRLYAESVALQALPSQTNAY